MAEATYNLSLIIHGLRKCAVIEQRKAYSHCYGDALYK